MGVIMQPWRRILRAPSLSASTLTSLHTSSAAFSRISVLRERARGLRDEARALSGRGARARAALRPVLSVAIAVTAAHAIGLKDPWWAAISGFIVMQED